MNLKIMIRYKKYDLRFEKHEKYFNTFEKCKKLYKN